MKILKDFYPNGTIRVPFSKSYIHRALISSFIADKCGEVYVGDISDDIQDTLNCIKLLGGNYIEEDGIVTFLKRSEAPSQVIFKIKESASTLRFLLPLASYICDNVRFEGSPNLFLRPLSIYKEYFDKHHINYIEGNDFFEIKGKFVLDDLEINDNVSSQFISGWLFLLAYANKGYSVKVNVPIQSKSYVDMTIDVLSKYGVKFVQLDHQIVHCFSSFNYVLFKGERDYSQAAFFAVLGTLKGKIVLDDLNFNSLQPDKKILDILMDMGAKITFNKNQITFSESLMRGKVIDIGECIDLGPILCVLGAFCYGETILTNTKRLKIKESSRGLAMANELKKAGVDIDVLENEIHIKGKNAYLGNYIFDTHGDHRIAMALSIFSIINKGQISLMNTECVNKSYPLFYQHLFSLDKIKERQINKNPI